MINLSSIFNLPEEGNEVITGVFIDKDNYTEDMLDPPPFLKAIGFYVDLDEDGFLSEELLDLIISYKTNGIDILIEVPGNFFASTDHPLSKIYQSLINSGMSQEEAQTLLVEGFKVTDFESVQQSEANEVEPTLSPSYFFQLSSNIGFDWSILPPGHEQVNSNFTLADYVSVMIDILHALLENPNYLHDVIPISGFLEYLMMEQVLGQNHQAFSKFKPTSHYIQENFSSVMSVHDSDLFKHVIRQEMYQFMGGKERFQAVSKLMISESIKHAKELTLHIVRDHLEGKNEESNQDDTKAHTTTPSQAEPPQSKKEVRTDKESIDVPADTSKETGKEKNEVEHKASESTEKSELQETPIKRKPTVVPRDVSDKKDS